MIWISRRFAILLFSVCSIFQNLYSDNYFSRLTTIKSTGCREPSYHRNSLLPRRIAMINDQQVKKLRSDLNGGMRLAAAALRSGMSEKTARKYRNMNQLPSEAQQPHHWRTRIDPFESVWDEIQQQLQQSPGLQAKTIFESLQRQYPGRFQDGQLRTLHLA